MYVDKNIFTTRSPTSSGITRAAKPLRTQRKVFLFFAETAKNKKVQPFGENRQGFMIKLCCLRIKLYYDSFCHSGEQTVS